MKLTLTLLATLMLTVSVLDGRVEAKECTCDEPVCGCESWDTCEPECGCDEACEPGCSYDDGCDSLGAGCLSGCLGGGGDPCSLFGSCHGLSIGGWFQKGYHSAASGRRFNSRDGEVQIHQAWMYAEKALDTSDGFDIGGRVDFLYGTDAQDTQAFGILNSHWDNDWDNGGDYGSALPQAYAEIGYGNVSIKAGHFYTSIGWEVVQAPDNFFYSHAYTMYNSEPFTHTGALATVTCSDTFSVFGGYTAGWDSGFEDNGDNFLGGFSAAMSDNATLTYATVAGRFVEETLERGYMHSVVLDVAVCDSFQYVLQSDLLSTENNVGATERRTFGINQYWVYNMSDCLAVGARFEWWNVHDGAGNKSDVYDLTLGCNVKPHANVLIRPEVRWDWDGAATPVGINENNASSQASFGIDSILLF